MENYKKYGIPDDLYLDLSNIYKYNAYAVFYIINIQRSLDFGSADLTNWDRALWSAADYWTELEASLLLAGLNPHSANLYAVGEKSTWNGDNLPISTHYFWVNENQFVAAKNYLFLFGRSSFAPSASPVEWVTYYKQKIYGKSVEHEFNDNYGKSWLDYFKYETSNANQADNSTFHLQQNPGRRDQQLKKILAVIDVLDFNPEQIPDGGKATIKTICLKSVHLFTDSGFDHAWKRGIAAEYFRMANHEKYSSNK